MASVDVRVTSGLYNNWSHSFQGANTTWLSIFYPSVRVGNFYIGLQGMSQQLFNAQIPKGATINSATMTVEARNTSSGSMTLPLKSFDRDTYYSEPLIAPFSIHTGIRRDHWSTAGMGALSTTFTAIAGTSVTTNSSWILKQTNSWRRKLWQLTPTRTGNMQLDFGIWEMFRTNNPTGSCRMRVQGVTTDKYGQKVPDGIDLAVSDDVLCSSIPLGPTVTTVGFTFSGQETLVASTEYFWGLEVDYTGNNFDHVSARHYNAFFTNGQLYHEGDGLGFDWQNYPGTGDCSIGANGVWQTPSVTVNWVVPNFVANTIYTSPDISALLQDQVNSAWYTADSGILIAAGTPNSGTIWRQYKSAWYPAVDRVRLLVDYTERTGRREQKKIWMSPMNGTGYHRR